MLRPAPLLHVTLHVTLRAALLVAMAGLAVPALAHDYPTSDRVVFVQACMRDNPGPHYEMVNKCSCVIDTLARDLAYDDFVSMSTVTNANSIGGERGSYIRDTETLQEQIRNFRKLQADAKKSCMIGVGPR
jgi:hypothetical protein